MKAEALALQQDFSGAIDILNDVRTRAGSDELQETLYGNEYDVITAILDERAVELFAEGKIGTICCVPVFVMSIIPIIRICCSMSVPMA